MPAARNLVIWITVSLIFVGAYSIASARPLMRDIAGQIVLCTGHGPETVFVDQYGNPVDSGPICPECLVSLSDMGLMLQCLPQPARSVSTVYFHDKTQGLDTQSVVRAMPRGPPRTL